MNAPRIYFDHEKLVAYQRGIQFVVWAHHLLEKVSSKLAVHDQLDRASTSVPLNIAEGNGKYTAPDRCRYFDTARGSALECAACLDVLVAKGQFTADQVRDGKAVLHETVSLLVGLIRSLSPERLRACLRIPRGAVFAGRAGWRGATQGAYPQRSVTEEQRSNAALPAKTLRAAALLAGAGVGSALTARCGDARTSPPCPQPKPLAAAPLAILRQALSDEPLPYRTSDGD